MSEWVRAVLSRTHPDRPVASVEEVTRGNHKRTATATFADGGSVVVQRSARSGAFRTELALLSAVGERTDLPVPAVLAVPDGEESTADAAAVLERAPGVDLHGAFVSLDRVARASVARAFGRALATLHEAFRFDAYGPVRVADGQSRAFAATGPGAWPAWFDSYAREGIAALPDPLADCRGDLLTAVEAASLPDRPPARLYPWDLRPGNALVDERALDGRGTPAEVTAFLDWGDPLSAAPGLAVAKTEHLVADWYVDPPARERLREAVRAGYRSVRLLPDVPRVYRLVAVVRSAVDSRGEVTRPGYPERTGEDAVAFHRERIESLLGT